MNQLMEDSQKRQEQEARQKKNEAKSLSKTI